MLPSSLRVQENVQKIKTIANSKFFDETRKNCHAHQYSRFLKSPKKEIKMVKFLKAKYIEVGKASFKLLVQRNGS